MRRARECPPSPWHLVVRAPGLHLPKAPAITIGLGIALIKASLVAMYFMHLKGERPMVYWPLSLTAFLFVGLLVSVLLSEGDHLFGTQFDDAFTAKD